MRSDTARLRKAIEVKRCIKMWARRNYVTPVLVTRVFGDGLKLLALYPMMFRPHHFVVRIGSDYDTSNWSNSERGPHFWLDDVYEAIEEEFVEWPWKRKYGLRWPKTEDADRSSRVSFNDGSAWDEIHWPKGFGRTKQ